MTAEPITVRLCTAEDLPALHAREPHPKAKLSQRHFDRQTAGNYFYSIAIRGELPLGTSVLDCDPANRLCPELKSLWVYPDARRQGAARALTTFLEVQANALGFVEVFLRVNPDNEAAIPMYIGLDYTPTGDHAMTNHEWVDEAGAIQVTEQLDAVYRKSLQIR